MDRYSSGKQYGHRRVDYYWRSQDLYVIVVGHGLEGGTSAIRKLVTNARGPEFGPVYTNGAAIILNDAVHDLLIKCFRVVAVHIVDSSKQIPRHRTRLCTRSHRQDGSRWMDGHKAIECHRVKK